MSELDNAIHTINRGEGAVDLSGKIVRVIGYTSSDEIPRDSRGHLEFRGGQEISVEDDRCYAKVVDIQKKDETVYSKYFVKMGIDGRLFNPWGMFSEGTEKKYAKRLGKPVWSFASCSKKCFDYYVNFLQSRNPAWLNNAEREVR